MRIISVSKTNKGCAGLHQLNECHVGFCLQTLELFDLTGIFLTLRQQRWNARVPIDVNKIRETRCSEERRAGSTRRKLAYCFVPLKKTIYFYFSIGLKSAMIY